METKPRTISSSWRGTCATRSRKQMRGIRSWGGQFVVPIPALQVLLYPGASVTSIVFSADGAARHDEARASARSRGSPPTCSARCCACAASRPTPSSPRPSTGASSRSAEAPRDRGGYARRTDHAPRCRLLGCAVRTTVRLSPRSGCAHHGEAALGDLVAAVAVEFRAEIALRLPALVRPASGDTSTPTTRLTPCATGMSCEPRPGPMSRAESSFRSSSRPRTKLANDCDWEPLQASRWRSRATVLAALPIGTCGIGGAGDSKPGARPQTALASAADAVPRSPAREGGLGTG